MFNNQKSGFAMSNSVTIASENQTQHKIDSTQIVGTGIEHESATRHVAGAAAYVDDIPPPEGTLHAYFGFASIGVARSAPKSKRSF